MIIDLICAIIAVAICLYCYLSDKKNGTDTYVNTPWGGWL